MTDPTDTAAAALESIREGGQQLVLNALSRLRECEEAITEGRFMDAQSRAQEAMGRIVPLAQAEATMGRFSKSRVIRACQLTEGMTLKGVGRVVSVEMSNHSTDEDPCVHVHVKVEGHEDELQWQGEAEVVVVAGDDDGGA